MNSASEKIIHVVDALLPHIFIKDEKNEKAIHAPERNAAIVLLESYPTLIESDDKEAYLHSLGHLSSANLALVLQKINVFFYAYPDLLSPETLDALIHITNRSNSTLSDGMESLKELLQEVPALQSAEYMNYLAYISEGVGKPLDENVAFVSQAFNALRKVFQGDTEKTHPRAILQSFLSMLGTQEGDLGYELEFNEDDNHEVRCGPFSHPDKIMASLRCAQTLTEISDVRSSLHLNFGLTKEQLQNIMKNEKTYKAIARKVAYLANSADRNLYLENNFGDKYRAIELHGSVDNDDTDNTLRRLECREFCIDKGADFTILRPFIDAMRIAINDPEKAQELNQSLNVIFKENHLKTLTKKFADETERLEWKADFETRQIQYRGEARECLEHFAIMHGKSRTSSAQRNRDQDETERF